MARSWSIELESICNFIHILEGEVGNKGSFCIMTFLKNISVMRIERVTNHRYPPSLA